MSEEVQAGDIAADLMNLSAPEPKAEEPAPEPEDSEPVEPQQDSAEGEEQPETDSEPAANDDAEEIIEGEAEEQSEEPEELSTDIAPTEEKVTLPDGGEVNKDELVNGYMRQADYTRKTAEIAEKRKEVDKVMEERNAEVAQVLDALVQRYHAFDPRAPYMQALQEAQQDGDTERATQLQGHIQGLTAEIERFEKASEYEQNQKQEKEGKTKQERIQYEREALMEKLPILKDPKKVQEFQKSTTNALKRFGYTEDEIAGMDTPDHRDAMAYYYADKYFQSLDKAPKVAEKLKGKAVTPKSRPRKAERDNGKSAALAKFNKNPNADGSLAGLLKTYGV